MGGMDYNQVFLLGDSLIQLASYTEDGFSFTSSLEEHCTRRLDVINRGLSGYNTTLMLDIFDHIIPSPSCAKIDYFLLLLGANDACIPNIGIAPCRQHVPLDEYTQNIKTMLAHPSVRAHAPKILLVTPPPLNEFQREVSDRLASTTASYAAAIRSIAGELQQESSGREIVLIDLWKGIMDEAIRLTPGYKYAEGQPLLGSKELGMRSEGLESLFTDGLHFTGKAYRIFSELVRKEIGEGWGDESLDDPKWVYPHWPRATERRKKNNAV